MTESETRYLSWPDGRAPTTAELEQAIDMPSWEWPGRCFDVARAVLQKTGLKGTAVYGFWTGPVVPSAFYNGREPRIRHGWIVTDAGPIADPTRFVFERTAPYIYYGANDHYADAQTIDWRLDVPNILKPDAMGRPPGPRANAPHHRRLRVRAQTKKADAARSRPGALR